MAKAEQVLSLEPQHELKFKGTRPLSSTAAPLRPRGSAARGPRSGGSHFPLAGAGRRRENVLQRRGLPASPGGAGRRGGSRRAAPRAPRRPGPLPPPPAPTPCRGLHRGAEGAPRGKCAEGGGGRSAAGPGSRRRGPALPPGRPSP